MQHRHGDPPHLRRRQRLTRAADCRRRAPCGRIWFLIREDAKHPLLGIGDIIERTRLERRGDLLRQADTLDEPAAEAAHDRGAQALAMVERQECGVGGPPLNTP